MSKVAKKGDASKKVKTVSASASEEYVEGIDGFWEKYSS